jgi:hypothetical protein
VKNYSIDRVRYVTIQNIKNQDYYLNS